MRLTLRSSKLRYHSAHAREGQPSHLLDPHCQLLAADAAPLHPWAVDITSPLDCIKDVFYEFTADVKALTSMKVENQDVSGMVCAKTSVGVGSYEEDRTGCCLRAARRTPDLGPPRQRG